MKHYEKLLELGCFSKNDLEQITGSGICMLLSAWKLNSPLPTAM